MPSLLLEAAQYQHYHSQVIEDATITACENFTKTNFLMAMEAT
jgi:hypothetical protein